MVMYANKTKENKNRNKDKIEPQHIHILYIKQQTINILQATKTVFVKKIRTYLRTQIV